MIHNPSAKKYLRRVRRVLPCVGKMKKEMMNMAACDISAFLQEQPEADYETIESRFGKPETIAAAYVENMGTAEILKKMYIRKRIMTALLLVLVFVVVTWILAVAWMIIRSEFLFDGYPLITMD